MTEQRARAEQAVAVVDVGIAVGVRVEPARGRDLVQVLGQMGLHVGVGMLAYQGTGGLELRLGRGQREAWRDRVELAALPCQRASSALLSR